MFQYVTKYCFDPKGEYIPTALQIGPHKVTGKLVICLAAQEQKLNHAEQCFDHYILILNFDQDNRYKCFRHKKFKTQLPQVTNIIYRPELGLIMSCLNGYVELFDAINDFISVAKWHNDISELENNPSNLASTSVLSRRGTVTTKNDPKEEKEDRQMSKIKIKDKERKTGLKVDFSHLDSSRLMMDPKELEEPKTFVSEVRLRSCGVHEKPDTHKPLYQSNFSLKKDRLSVKKQSVTTIDCLDYSEELSIIAFGGVSGKMGILDGRTLLCNSLIDAHEAEIVGLNFYDSQR